MKIKLFENYIDKKLVDYITEDNIKNGLIDLIDRDYIVSVYKQSSKPMGYHIDITNHQETNIFSDPDKEKWFYLRDISETLIEFIKYLEDKFGSQFSYVLEYLFFDYTVGSRYEVEIDEDLEEFMVDNQDLDTIGVMLTIQFKQDKKYLESFNDKWPPTGPFDSMEEVDKVCDELRDMFVDFKDMKNDVKVTVQIKGSAYDNDGRYSITIGLSHKNREIGESYNTDIVSDSVAMACDYMKEFHDFEVSYKYFYYDKAGEGKKFESTKFYKKDNVFTLFIIFKERVEPVVESFRLFENVKLDNSLDSIGDCLVELKDIGFEYTVTNNDEEIKIVISKPFTGEDYEEFNAADIANNIEFLHDYMKETFKKVNVSYYINSTFEEFSYSRYPTNELVERFMTYGSFDKVINIKNATKVVIKYICRT